MKRENKLYIAVLLTCFNRKDKTCACLHHLHEALKVYNDKHAEVSLSIEVFLVDDGCTDGTASAVQSAFEDVHVIQGTGSLFWAGGMRLAWSEAYKRHSEWSFYLLLNDDTNIFPEAFSLLIQTHLYSMEHYRISGVYTGATCAKDDKSRCTYGGDVWINRIKGTTRRLSPSGTPQMCDVANANIMLVESSVVDKIGMLCKDYQHSLADYDYAIRARKAGIPVLLTSDYCGVCDNDHVDSKELAERICSMSLGERRRYFKHPVHSSCDYLRFIRNTSIIRWPMVWVGRMFNLYFPRFYYKLSGIR